MVTRTMGECIHYWVIDATDHGVCKNCGAQKKFLSLRQLRSWDDERGERGRKVKAKKRVHRKKDVVDN